MNIGNSYSCVLCNSGHEETLEHLFFGCSYTTSCWTMLNITWNIGMNRFDMIGQAKTSFQGSLFFEVFIIAAWGIWKERNNLIFKGINTSTEAWKARIIEDLQLLRFRVNQNLQDTITLFIDRI
jgi:hypothetical protein